MISPIKCAFSKTDDSVNCTDIGKTTLYGHNLYVCGQAQ